MEIELHFLKIYFHVWKIDFQLRKHDFHVLKIKFRIWKTDVHVWKTKYHIRKMDYHFWNLIFVCGKSNWKRCSLCLPTFFEWALRHWMGPLHPGMGPLRPKICPYRPDVDVPKHANYLFSLNVDSDRLQYLILRTENGPTG